MVCLWRKILSQGPSKLAAKKMPKNDMLGASTAPPILKYKLPNINKLYRSKGLAGVSDPRKEDPFGI
jgi:hypothetical protein